jgi:nucleotide-binding universal stress UspA family protein
MFNRILVVLEGLEEGQQAFTTALSIARSTAAEMAHPVRFMLLQILPADGLSYQSLYSIPGVAHYPNWQSEIQDHLTEYQQYKSKSWENLRSLHATAKAAGIASDFAQLLGQEADPIICEMACKWGADLIVIKGYQPDVHPSEEAGYPHAMLVYGAPCSILVAQDNPFQNVQAYAQERAAVLN